MAAVSSSAVARDHAAPTAGPRHSNRPLATSARAALALWAARGSSGFASACSFVPPRDTPAASSGDGMRALPNMTTVAVMPRSRWSISGFRNSSCSRAARSSSRSRKSGSAKPRRYAGDRVCGVSGSRSACRWSSSAEGKAWGQRDSPGCLFGRAFAPASVPLLTNRFAPCAGRSRAGPCLQSARWSRAP